MKEKILPGVIGQMRDALDFAEAELTLRTDVDGARHETVLVVPSTQVSELAQAWAKGLGASHVTYVRIRGCGEHRQEWRKGRL